MPETKPQMGPDGSSGSGAGAGTSGAASAPSAIPPGGAAKVAAKGDCGCGGSATVGGQSAGAALPPTVGTGDAAPSLHPAESVGANVTTWLNDKRITGLWSLNQNRNSWVYVTGNRLEEARQQLRQRRRGAFHAGRACASRRRTRPSTIARRAML